MIDFTPVPELRSVEEFTSYLDRSGIALPFDAEIETGETAPMAQPIDAGGLAVGNRWAILPLEGWDSDQEGRPTDRSLDRWRAFGRSGAKLIWGESTAVRPDGRSSPGQILVVSSSLDGLTRMVQSANQAHRAGFDDPSDFKVGIQLTHSGRLSHPGPDGAPSPVTVRHLPHMDETGAPGSPVRMMSDDDLYELADAYVDAATLIAEAGFDFVDLKACHGYLSHELLGAFEREGEFGGSLDNRTRFLRLIIQGVRVSAPDLKLALRVSAFDTVAFNAAADGVGAPFTSDPYRFWFGTDETGHEVDLTEPIELLSRFRDMGVDLICVTGSSPYNAWHFQRPALSSKPGEYITPEDPLAGVARHIDVTRRLRDAVPGITTVGSGYSYLQQWLPNVAQAAVRREFTDLVGIARMHLARPTFAADVSGGVSPNGSKIGYQF
ncbi:MAG: NADH:flavin oxidoreductase [Acidimicrobiia bacterium]